MLQKGKTEILLVFRILASFVFNIACKSLLHHVTHLLMKACIFILQYTKIKKYISTNECVLVLGLYQLCFLQGHPKKSEIIEREFVIIG